MSSTPVPPGHTSPQDASASSWRPLAADSLAHSARCLVPILSAGAGSSSLVGWWVSSWWVRVWRGRLYARHVWRHFEHCAPKQGRETSPTDDATVHRLVRSPGGPCSAAGAPCEKSTCGAGRRLVRAQGGACCCPRRRPARRCPIGRRPRAASGTPGGRAEAAGRAHASGGGVRKAR